MRYWRPKTTVIMQEQILVYSLNSVSYIDEKIAFACSLWIINLAITSGLPKEIPGKSKLSKFEHSWLCMDKGNQTYNHGQNIWDKL